MGVHDCHIYENTPSERILDGFGALVSGLKQKDENMDIYICQLVPNHKTDVLLQKRFTNLNEDIAK